jgi:hypothetical protein
VFGALLLFAFLLQLAREAWAARARRDDWAVWAALAAAMVVPIFLYSQFEGRFFSEPYLWLALGMFYGAQMVAVRAGVVLERKAVASRRGSVEVA